MRFIYLLLLIITFTYFSNGNIIEKRQTRTGNDNRIDYTDVDTKVNLNVTKVDTEKYPGTSESVSDPAVIAKMNTDADKNDSPKDDSSNSTNNNSNNSNNNDSNNSKSNNSNNSKSNDSSNSKSNDTNNSKSNDTNNSKSNDTNNSKSNNNNKGADIIENLKNDTNDSNNTNVDTVENTTECQKFTVDFANCFPYINNNLIINAETCNNFYSSECQALLNRDKSICGNAESKIFEYKIVSFNFGCAKNEKNNYCPQLKTIENDIKTGFIYDKYCDKTEIKEIHQSKACTESAVNFFKQMKQIFIVMESNTSYYDYLIDKIDKSIDTLNGNSSSSSLLITGLIFGGIFIILISIYASFLLIKRSKNKNDDNYIKNEADTSLGRVVFLNQPRIPETNNVLNQQYNRNIQNQPPPAYDNKNMVMITNDKKLNIKLYSEAFDKKTEMPPVYTEKIFTKKN